MSNFFKRVWQVVSRPVRQTDGHRGFGRLQRFDTRHDMLEETWKVSIFNKIPYMALLYRKLVGNKFYEYPSTTEGVWSFYAVYSRLQRDFQILEGQSG